jgi:hypothetical protein
VSSNSAYYTSKQGARVGHCVSCRSPLLWPWTPCWTQTPCRGPCRCHCPPPRRSPPRGGRPRRAVSPRERRPGVLGGWRRWEGQPQEVIVRGGVLGVEGDCGSWSLHAWDGGRGVR